MGKSDRELLGEFVESGSERIFAALVERHAGMVFGAALRVTRSRELAEDTASTENTRRNARSPMGAGRGSPSGPITS